MVRNFYHVEINWNRNLAVQACASSVVASAMLREHVDGQFGAPEKCNRTFKKIPSLDELLEMRIGESFSGALWDETGRATWAVVNRGPNFRFNVPQMIEHD